MVRLRISVPKFRYALKGFSSSSSGRCGTWALLHRNSRNISADGCTGMWKRSLFRRYTHSNWKGGREGFERKAKMLPLFQAVKLILSSKISLDSKAGALAIDGISLESPLQQSQIRAHSSSVISDKSGRLGCLPYGNWNCKITKIV